MVLGVPENSEPPDPMSPDPASSGSVGADARAAGGWAVEAVLFDFQGTLAQVESPVTRVLAAAAACGVALDRGRATVLADRLTTAGLVGGPLPTRVPPQLAEVWAERDLFPYAHRAAFVGLAALVECDVEGLAEALYERLLLPEGWLPYSDTGPTLRALRAAGIRVGVVSNVGFDIRPLFAAWGLDDLVQGWTLSFEVGRCKPDPAIFIRACVALGADPERTLMVGDTPADAGAVAAGCAALVLPAGDPGAANGLSAVLALTGR
jgi:HAD superfamily hydrolase (TIGR01509 family)